MKQKPNLSIFQIINMSMGFLGIQMGFALQNANASRILQNFGAEVEKLPLMWLVAPLMGLLVQPIVGHFGDHTWTKLGRRKPYFLGGALLASLGLILLPNTAYIATEGMKEHYFLGMSMLMWLAVLFLAFMDGSFNISMEPFRALVGDMLPKKQGSLGFSVQTILIGIGAVLGSVLPTLLENLGVTNVAPKGFVAPTVVYSFYIGALVLMITIIYTIITTQEYTPKEFDEFAGKLESLSKEKSKFSDIFVDLKNMPQRMKRLGAVQFFTWFALFMMWVFTTSALATHYYGLTPNIKDGPIFEKAGNMVGSLFGQYNFWAVPFAFALIPLSRYTSRKFVHFVALICGAFGLISLKYLGLENLWFAMIGIGFAWASILAMPYALLVDSLPIHKMGIYMGIFNFFIVVPQIVNGLLSPYIVKEYFNEYAMNMLVIAGFSMLIAALLTLRIETPLFRKGDFQEIESSEN